MARRRPPRGITFYRYYFLQRGCCVLCGLKMPRRWGDSDGAATWDHITPLSAGGDDVLGNIALAHRLCNTRRGNRRPPRWYVLRGLELRRLQACVKTDDAMLYWRSGCAREVA